MIEWHSQDGVRNEIDKGYNAVSGPPAKLLCKTLEQFF